MYVIPVKAFLGLEEWVPHQDALESGLLQEYDHDTMAEKVLFISHQWSGWMHPDPKLEQMKTLKAALRKLLEGSTSVRSNAVLELRYNWFVKHTGAWWKERLPKMFLWIDFVSMPQPLSARFKGMSKAAVEEAMAAEKRARHAGMTAEDGEVQGNSGMDHRLVQDKEVEVARLVKLLTTAVDCIPGYIQRCAMMWVLVPPTTHADVDSAVCDFASWRNRGWCRMEFKASKLKVGSDMPVLILGCGQGGGDDQLTYINPCDCWKLNPSSGDFSVEADRPKVQGVLNELYDAKLASYLEQNDLMAYRVCLMLRASSTSKYELSAEEHAVGGAAAIARVKGKLKWRDEPTEDAWMAKHHISLLLCAICLNDRPAVRALLERPDAASALGMYTRAPWSAKEKAAAAYRTEPFATLCLAPFQNLSPTCAAVGYADLEVLEMVLAARPPPPLLLSGRDHNDSWLLPISYGDVRFYERLVEAYTPSEHGLMFAKPLDGFSWLSVAMLSLGASQKEILDLLLANGAAMQVNAADMGLTPLVMGVVANPEVGISAIRQLVERGADVNKKDAIPTVLKALVGTLSALGVRKMTGVRHFLAEFDRGGTPLHHAVVAGNLAAVRALVELGADVDAKDRKGARPIELARAVHAGSRVGELLVARLEAGGAALGTLEK